MTEAARGPAGRLVLVAAGAAAVGVAAGLFGANVFVFAVALFACLAMLVWPREGTLAVAFLTPLNNLAVLHVPNVVDLRFQEVLWLTLLLGLLVRRAAGRPFPIVAPPRWLAYGLSAIVGWYLVSWVVNGGGLRSFVKVAQLGGFAIVMWLVAAMFAATPARERVRAARMAGVGGSILLGLSLLYVAFGLDWPITVHATVGGLIEFQPPDVKLQAAGQLGIELVRMGVFNLSVVTAASLMAGIVGVGIAAVLSAKDEDDRLLGWWVFVLAGVVLVLTFSRAGWAVGVLVLLLVAWRAGRDYFLPMALIVAILATSLLLLPQVSARLSEFSDTSEGSTQAHFRLWRTAFGFANEQPIFGGGPYSFVQRTRVTVDEPPHNFVLEAAADTGWVGAAIVVAFVWKLLVWGWKRSRGRPLLEFALWTGTLATILMNLTMNGFREDMWWVWGGLMVGAFASARDYDDPEPAVLT